MAQYFFGMTKSEKDSILNQHKHIYDGYVTQYAQGNNQQPLYVQDYANDKGGITVSNKGVVKPYTNMNINESFDGSDMIGDGSMDLKNGTVDMNDIKGMEYISLGNSEDYEDCKHCDEDNLDIVIDFDVDGINFDEYEDEENYVASEDEIEDEVDEDELPEVMEKINESLDMFRRFKNYN
jgi:hypothetical protein